MTGRTDTPAERHARTEAMAGEPDGLPVLVSSGKLVDRTGRPLQGSAGTAVEVVEAERYEAGSRYGRRYNGPRSAHAVVASAARLQVNDKRSIEATRKRRQGWQTEAWDYFDEVGEIGYTTTYIANLMSKLRLYPAASTPDGPVAVSVLFETDDEHSEAARKVLADKGITAEYAQVAIDTLARLRSMQGGQSALIRELSLNLEIAGECYIHGHVEKESAADPGDDAPEDFDPADGYGTDPNMVEDWNVRSVDELQAVGDEYHILRGPGAKMGAKVPDGDLLIRVWERHPRFSEMATCAMRRVLAEAEALLLLSREVRATSKSRLSNGILLIPSELSFGSLDPNEDEGDGEETDDPFDNELAEAMITPIQEEGSASAVVPIVLRGPAELLQHVNHLALDKSLDPVLDARIEQRILRIARGLNMPTEVTTGFMATTFANAAQIKRSEFEDHVEPRAVLVCDGITSGYFQWALEEADVPAEIAHEIFTWYDASQLIQVEDMSEQATKAHEDGVISDAARRRYTGFLEEDAPDLHELALRIVLKGGRIDPTIFGYLLRSALNDPDMPVPAPPAGVLGEIESVSAMPAPGVAEGTAPVLDGEAAPAVAAAGGRADPWAKLGGQLVGIDRELRSRIIAKLDQAMRSALERAGLRIKAKVQRDKGGAMSQLRRLADTAPLAQVAATLGRQVVTAAGVADDDLVAGVFDSALDDIRVWLDVAYDRAVRALERCAGRLPIPVRAQLDSGHVQNTDAAIDWLRSNLHQLAKERLYSPLPGVAPAGEHDATVLIPASLVRAALAVAGGSAPTGGTAVVEMGELAAGAWLQLGGGGPVAGSDGRPVGGLAGGEDMMTAVGSVGASVEGWQWEYGAGIRSEFEPHLELDGSVVATTDDPSWANTGDFPATDFYFPGDHDGCVCDIIPVVMGPQGMATESLADYETINAPAAEAAAETAAEEEAGGVWAVQALDESGFSTLTPDRLADVLGYARGDGDVGEAELAAAKGSYGQAKAEIRRAAAQIAYDHEALITSEVGTRGSFKYVFNAADRAKQGDTGTGLYDWFDDLSAGEKARLRANWLESRAAAAGSTASNYDEVAEALAVRFGMDPGDDYNVMKRWVQETRIIDAAKAVANNKLINPDRYGGLDINELLDTPYDLRDLFGYKENSVEAVAKVQASQVADDARQLLGAAGYGPHLGPAPWEMSEAEYVREVTEAEAAARDIQPIREDEWDGPVYAPEDERTLNRLRELLPPGVDDPSNPQPFNLVYREILAVARLGGLI